MSAGNLVHRALGRAARALNIGTARLDYVLDEAERASEAAQERARAAGLDDQTVVFESLDAYHQRRHELLSQTRGITDAQLVARADERDGTDLDELAEIEAQLAQPVEREQTKVAGFVALSEADEQRIRELQGREELTELEDMELDDLLVTRCELAAAHDELVDELDDETEIELDR